MLFKKKKKDEVPEVKPANIHLIVFTKDGGVHSYSDVTRYGGKWSGFVIYLDRPPLTNMVFFKWEFVNWYQRVGEVRMNDDWLEGIE